MKGSEAAPSTGTIVCRQMEWNGMNERQTISTFAPLITSSMYGKRRYWRYESFSFRFFVLSVSAPHWCLGVVWEHIVSHCCWSNRNNQYLFVYSWKQPNRISNGYSTDIFCPQLNDKNNIVECDFRFTVSAFGCWPHYHTTCPTLLSSSLANPIYSWGSSSPSYAFRQTVDGVGIIDEPPAAFRHQPNQYAWLKQLSYYIRFYVELLRYCVCVLCCVYTYVKYQSSARCSLLYRPSWPPPSTLGELCSVTRLAFMAIHISFNAFQMHSLLPVAVIEPSTQKATSRYERWCAGRGMWICGSSQQCIYDESWHDNTRNTIYCWVIFELLRPSSLQWHDCEWWPRFLV